MTGMLINGKTSLSSHAGMGPKRAVGTFADETGLVSESRSTGEKWSKCNSVSKLTTAYLKMT